MSQQRACHCACVIKRLVEYIRTGGQVHHRSTCMQTFDHCNGYILLYGCSSTSRKAFRSKLQPTLVGAESVNDSTSISRCMCTCKILLLHLQSNSFARCAYHASVTEPCDAEGIFNSPCKWCIPCHQLLLFAGSAAKGCKNVVCWNHHGSI